MPGVIGTIKLAATLAFALPVGLMGATFLADGRPLGAVFLVVAVGMVVVQRVVFTPEDVPAAAAERAAGWVVKDEE